MFFCNLRILGMMRSQSCGEKMKRVFGRGLVIHLPLTPQFQPFDSLFLDKPIRFTDFLALAGLGCTSQPENSKK